MTETDQILRAIGNLEGTLKTHMNEVENVMAQHRQDIQGLSVRMRKQERFKAWLMGGAAAMGAGASALFKWVGSMS